MEYRICNYCVMDTTDPDIKFDESGRCNHCKNAESIFSNSVIGMPISDKKTKLDGLVLEIKQNGKNKKYDCIIGLSGGVDSSYVAYLVVELGLRPLAVHLDNGWDAELAVKNIENICKKLKIDLLTHVIDWEEFRDLQMAFLLASTPDSEIPSDHAISAILYKTAVKYNIKYIIAGTNWSSESILPAAWSQGHSDWYYIRGIWKRFGEKRCKTYPYRSYQFKLLAKLKSIRWVELLDLIDYDKEKAKSFISDRLGWKNYGRKHGESNYTKFFQEYILPIKFNYDKRRAHFSSLIVAGQLTREQALEQLEEPLYENNLKIEDDINYFITKFNISRDGFDNIMNALPMKYDDYPNVTKTLFYKLYKIIRKY